LQDETCPPCVIGNEFIFLSHHAGGFESNDIVHQIEACFEHMSKTMESIGASLDDMVEINLYLKNIGDFRLARDAFFKCFKDVYSG
jgi:2-iminobutanoate/2-iminopropanoate deaminase